ncbi:TPA: AAA family ATPase [Methanosarcinaceae archaeon]|nr:AAA family ATPase [Methanosarcinaceae archaeon]
MIPGFYIKMVKVTGPGKEDASIGFDKGLNVVSGPSDTGKSYLLGCINYLMGGDTPPKSIEEANGYECVWMQLSSYSGKSYTLKRTFQDSNIYMTEGEIDDANTRPLIEGLSSSHSSKKEDNISVFLLKMIGLHNKKLKESKYKKRPIRFSDVKTVFLKDENEIIAEHSPIYVGQHTSVPVEKALFNLLLSGEDDEDLVQAEDPKVYKNIIKGKIELTERLLGLERERATELSEKVAKANQKEMNIKIEELSRSINESNQLIKDQENKRAEILKSIFQVEAHITHLKELLERFSILDAHYIADLKRLEFILEGEHLLSQLPNMPCPTCGTNVDSTKIKDYLERNNEKLVKSISRERIKITTKREELKSTEFDISEELEDYQKEKSELHQSLKKLSILLENKLKPINKILREDFQKYISLNQDTARLEDAKEIISRYEMELEEYKIKIKEKDKGERENKRLPEVHYQKLCDQMKEQLIGWGMSINTLNFDTNKMDFIINGKARGNFGKGSRAILCSAFLISLMKYCWVQETYHPCCLVLDSPLTTYREGDKRQNEDEVEVSVQEAFYKDLASITDNFQIIVFDNKDPSNELLERINYHHFTRNPNLDRYGFFPI